MGSEPQTANPNPAPHRSLSLLVTLALALTLPQHCVQPVIRDIIVEIVQQRREELAANGDDDFVRDGDLLGELLMEAEGRAMSDDDILYATSQPFSLTSCAGCFEHCALTLTVTLRLCPVPATASCRAVLDSS